MYGNTVYGCCRLKKNQILGTKKKQKRAKMRMKGKWKEMLRRKNLRKMMKKRYVCNRVVQHGVLYHASVIFIIEITSEVEEGEIVQTYSY